MAWRIHDSVTHGEIDNRKTGVVEGKVWLHGNKEPILLRLRGNCWSDLAGCRLTFRNPEPVPESNLTLARCQEGVVGDMTVSRKVRVPTVSREELSRRIRDHEPIPTQLGNSIYLEWFSCANGRVVLEAAHYQCELSPPEWSMTADEEKEQRRKNEQNLQDFLQNLVNQQCFLDNGGEDGEEEPLDEFQWEQLLRQSDKITDQYLEALEKYRDHPDCDRLIAEEMGWDWLIEEGDLPPENPLFDFVKEATGETDGSRDDEESVTFEGEPEEDWEDDDEHPVAKRARELASHVYQMTEERGLLKSQDATLLSLLTCSNAAAAKIGGALNAIIDEDDLPDYGFAIASLKRSLIPLHQAVAAATRIAERIPEESEWLTGARDEFFYLRQDILRLMQEFRDEL